MNLVEAVLNRLRDAAAQIPGLDSPYPLAVPSFEPGCQDGEIKEIEGAWPLPSDYREYLSHCRRIDASDVFNGSFVFSPIQVATNDGPGFFISN